jgi:hypothetical protein
MITLNGIHLLLKQLPQIFSRILYRALRKIQIITRFSIQRQIVITNILTLAHKIFHRTMCYIEQERVLKEFLNERFQLHIQWTVKTHMLKIRVYKSRIIVSLKVH